MSTEILERQVETGNNRSSWTILLCEKINSHTEVRPTKIDLNSDDEISRFVGYTLEKFEQRTKELSLPVGSFKGHGLRRSQSEIRQIREARNKMLAELREHIEILKGRRNQPIALIRSSQSQEIIGFKILNTNGCDPNL